MIAWKIYYYSIYAWCIFLTFYLQYKIIKQTKKSIALFEVVAAEKIHQNLLNGVEHFDKNSMKHAETSEKNTLPPIEGLLWNWNEIVLQWISIKNSLQNSYSFAIFKI